MFRHAKTTLELVQPFEDKLSKAVEQFDFVYLYPNGERVKGNGFRSLLYVYNSALTGLKDVLTSWSRRHGGWFFVVTEHLDVVRAHT